MANPISKLSPETRLPSSMLQQHLDFLFVPVPLVSRLLRISRFETFRFLLRGLQDLGDAVDTEQRDPPCLGGRASGRFVDEVPLD